MARQNGEREVKSMTAKPKDERRMSYEDRNSNPYHGSSLISISREVVKLNKNSSDRKKAAASGSSGAKRSFRRDVYVVSGEHFLYIRQTWLAIFEST